MARCINLNSQMKDFFTLIYGYTVSGRLDSIQVKNLQKLKHDIESYNLSAIERKIAAQQLIKFIGEAFCLNAYKVIQFINTGEKLDQSSITMTKDEIKIIEQDRIKPRTLIMSYAQIGRELLGIALIMSANFAKESAQFTEVLANTHYQLLNFIFEIMRVSENLERTFANFSLLKKEFIHGTEKSIERLSTIVTSIIYGDNKNKTTLLNNTILLDLECLLKLLMSCKVNPFVIDSENANVLHCIGLSSNLTWANVIFDYIEKHFQNELEDFPLYNSPALPLKKTPLHFITMKHGNSKKGIQFAKLLIEKGADVNAVDYDQETPLYWIAKAHGNNEKGREFAELLIKNGALTNIVNYKNQTPLDVAIKSGGLLLKDLLSAKITTLEEVENEESDSQSSSPSSFEDSHNQDNNSASNSSASNTSDSTEQNLMGDQNLNHLS